ncbi:MAG: tetratricopeptide repeat protein, partial [Pseudomonadota bacterium]
MTQKSGIFGLLAKHFREKIARRNLHRGDLLRIQGRSEEAASAYRHALSMKPDGIEAWFNLAETFSDMQQWEAAVESYRGVLALDLDYKPALRGLSKALFLSGQYEALLASEFDRDDLGPEFFTVFDTLGDAFYKKNLADDALRAYQKAFQLVPNSWQVAHKLGRAKLKTQCFDEAAACFKEVIAINPDYNWAHDGLGDALRFQHQWEASAEAFRCAIALDPDYHWHHFKLGEVLMQSGLWKQAANAYRQCERIDPFLPGLSDRLLEVEFNLEQWSNLEQFCLQQSGNEQDRKNCPSNEAEQFMLLIAAQPPYPPTGGANRLLEQIKYFGARHRLVVFCFHFSEYESEIKALLEQYCEFAFLAKPGGRREGLDEAIPEKIKDLITCDAWNALSALAQLKFDWVLFDFIYTTGYRDLFADHFTILQEHNIESRILQQMIEQQDDHSEFGLTDTLGYDAQKLQIEHQKLRNYETSTWPRFDLRVTTSEVDKNEMGRRFRGDI